jgi:hypothetical protein
LRLGAAPCSGLRLARKETDGILPCGGQGSRRLQGGGSREPPSAAHARRPDAGLPHLHVPPACPPPGLRCRLRRFRASLLAWSAGDILNACWKSLIACSRGNCYFPAKNAVLSKLHNCLNGSAADYRKPHAACGVALAACILITWLCRSNIGYLNKYRKLVKNSLK